MSFAWFGNHSYIIYPTSIHRWPGIVTPDPWSVNEFFAEEREGCIYHVEFLGRARTHLWLPEEMVRNAMALLIKWDVSMECNIVLVMIRGVMIYEA